MALLTFTEEYLRDCGAYWTAREIRQQPRMWLAAAQQVDKDRVAIDRFLQPLLKQRDLRIILTGAGTSAYIGSALAPHLSQKLQRKVEAISTTDIVSNAPQYLLKGIPTLLVSYARSGNSPESIAAVGLADQLIDQCYHLIITCNEHGRLVVDSKTHGNLLSLTMPEGTLDKSFAMTSSFTAMVVSTLQVFSPDPYQLEKVAACADNFLSEGVEGVKRQAEIQSSRMVFLGSGGLDGYAREAALKVLELTAGKVASFSESFLGFRHGPKSVLTQDTEVYFLSSNDPHTARYDMDLIRELERENKTRCRVSLKNYSRDILDEVEDAWLGLFYICYCQLLAFFKSLNCGISVDNPCPTGEVNRVVQGVTLYPLADSENFNTTLEGAQLD